MEHAITVNDVVTVVLILVGIGVVLAIGAGILWFMAQGWDH
jgi:hypothetical protein